MSAERDPLDSLAEEFVSRRRRGERVTIVDYAQAHPEHAGAIRDLFPALVAIESLKEPAIAMSGRPRPANDKPPERVGDCRIIREIGRGGMGVVYEAIQESLGRRVAVKVLPEGAIPNEKYLHRFLRESRNTAKLHHSNIVSVFGVGRDEGLHYFVMQYIRGVGLDKVLPELHDFFGYGGRDDKPASSPAAESDDPRPLAESTAAEGAAAQRTDAERAGDDTRPADAPDSPAGAPAADKSAESGAAPSAGIGKETRFKSAPNKRVEGRKSSAPQGGNAEHLEIVSPAAVAKRWLIGPTSSRAKQEQRYWREVATIGLQVAEALNYAHGRGIVHRDIKPGNLLIDEHGVVWVTDFGLAKTLSASGSHPGSDIVGTIRYMAPEQFQGECDPRCDVYSLGLTLYEMLTLRPAYTEPELGKLIHLITTTDPPAPRTLQPRIPRDLEAIVRKAMSRDPRQRYSTAGLLVEDLRRFLEDKPIRARNIPVVERIGKFSRRNPALTCLSMLLITTVIAAFALISWKWREAEFENRRAERNLALALDSMEETLNVFATTWMSHPVAPQSDEEGEATEFRMVASLHSARLLQKAMQFYDQFAAENARNPRLRRDMASVHSRMGEIRQRLGQLKEAEAAHRKALEIFDEMRRRHPSDADLARDTAAAWNSLGGVQRELARFHDAEAAHIQAQEALLPFAQGESRSQACCFELARTCGELGGVKSRLGQFREARQHLRNGLDLLEELIRTDGDRPEYLVAQARCCVSLYRASLPGPLRTTRHHIDTAIEVLEKLVALYPDVPDYQFELAETLISFSVSGRWDETPEERERLMRRAIQLSGQISEKYPNIPRYRASLARASHWLARSLWRARQLDEAEELGGRAASLYRELATDFPLVDAYQSFSALACRSYGEILRARNLLPESRAALEESVARQAAYLAKRPEDRFRKLTLGQHYLSLAETLQRQGEHRLAVEAERQAEQLGAGRFGPRRDKSRGSQGSAS